MSPEQIRGEATDARSDIYSCAAVLFELLTGRRPFVADGVEVMTRLHLQAAVPDPRELDATITPQLAQVCLTGLAKDRDDRYQTAQQLLTALEQAARDRYGAAWRTGLGLGAIVGATLADIATAADGVDAPVQHIASGGRSRRRPSARAVAVLVAAVLVAVAVVIAVAVTRQGPSRHHAASPPVPTVAACTASGLVSELVKPLAGDRVDPRHRGAFDRHTFLTTLSAAPDADNTYLVRAGFTCGAYRFAPGTGRGDTIYLFELHDHVAATVLTRQFAAELQASSGAQPFTVSSIPGAAGVAYYARTSSLGAGPYFGEAVLFPCGSVFAQVDVGYNSPPPGPADAIGLAQREFTRCSAGH